MRVLTLAGEAHLSGRFKPLLIGCTAVALLATPAVAHATAALVREETASWTDYIRALWPVFVVVAGLIVAGMLLGLATRFPTIVAFNSLKATVDKLESKVTSHDRRIQATESYCAGTPSRQELQEDIAELGERLRGVEVGVEGVGKQLGTTNTYLHTLLERGLRP